MKAIGMDKLEIQAAIQWHDKIEKIGGVEWKGKTLEQKREFIREIEAVIQEKECESFGSAVEIVLNEFKQRRAGLLAAIEREAAA